MHYCYDIETYPNFFSCYVIRVEDWSEWYFEMSPWMNNVHDMRTFFYQVRDSGGSMVGFNNIGFDYPVCHHVLMHSHTPIDARLPYAKADQIINGSDRFGHMIWESDMITEQLDLFKIHHFDNVARSTSLKMLEFNMRSNTIQDLPIPPGTIITEDTAPVMRQYNRKDVVETVMFFLQKDTQEMISFRRELAAQYGPRYLNFNDTKIGKEYFIQTLEQTNPGTCYDKSSGRKQPRQTARPSIKLGDVIFPYVWFEHPEFNRILTYLQNRTITGTKDVLPDVHCTIDGFTYHFGTGGIHGSVESQTVRSDERYAIIDLDVTSYYPTLAIKNRVYPEHLGEQFCDIYEDVFKQRMQYDKKTQQSKMLKLALNGVYGDSNNKYSPFYDPQYTMTITINGQLLLCMLADQLRKIPNLSMVQINTDGLTVRIPRDQIPTLEAIWQWWEQVTQLELEAVHYDRMNIRDVNNYIGVFEDGSTKNKGAYQIQREWHKNHSALIIPKAAHAALVDGEDIASFIMSPDRDVMDFMLRTKAPRNNKLILTDNDGNEYEQQRITRYYIANQGQGSLTKVAPPTHPERLGWFKPAQGTSDQDYLLWHNTQGNVWNPDIHTKNKSTYIERRLGIDVGHTVDIANNVVDINPRNINYAYYINETKKLVEPLL